MTTHRLSLCVAGLLACLLPLSASAQSKVDLSAFFLPNDEVGDFKIYQGSDGSERRGELLEMAAVGKKIRYLLRFYENGELTSIEESFTVPGKKLMMGDASFGDFFVDFAKPKTDLPLRIAIGKPFRFKGGARLYYQGLRAGKVKVNGSVVFVGFEPLTTPAFARDVTARFQRSITFTYLLGRGAPVFSTVAETTSWVAEDLGAMAYTTRARNYEDGVLLEEFGPVDYWFESGVLGGVPLP